MTLRISPWSHGFFFLLSIGLFGLAACPPPGTDGTPTPTGDDDDDDVSPTPSVEPSQMASPTAEPSPTPTEPPTPTAPLIPICGPDPRGLGIVDGAVRTGDAVLTSTGYVQDGANLWSGCEMKWVFSGGALQCYTRYVTTGIFNTGNCSCGSGGLCGQCPNGTVQSTWSVNILVEPGEDTCGDGANSFEVRRTDYYGQVNQSETQVLRQVNTPPPPRWFFIDQHGVGAVDGDGGSVRYTQILP